MPSSAAREVLDLIEPRTASAPVSLADIAARLQHLDVTDAIAAGFSFSSPTDHTGDRVVQARPGGLPAGTFTLMLSPQRGHRALQWHEHESDRLRLWIDATEIALPTDAAGERLVEPSGQWASERLFVAEVQVPDHPRQEWSRVPGTGTVFGLLVCDAKSSEWRLELPRGDEVWPQPRLRVRGTRVLLYADRAAFDAGVPTREWALSGN